MYHEQEGTEGALKPFKAQRLFHVTPYSASNILRSAHKLCMHLREAAAISLYIINWLVFTSITTAVITRDSSVSIVTRLLTWEIWGSNSGREKRFPSSLEHPHGLWISPNLSLNEYRRLFALEQRGWSVKVNNSQPPTAEINMTGVTPPFPLYAFRALKGKLNF